MIVIFTSLKEVWEWHGQNISAFSLFINKQKQKNTLGSSVLSRTVPFLQPIKLQYNAPLCPPAKHKHIAQHVESSDGQAWLMAMWEKNFPLMPIGVQLIPYFGVTAKCWFIVQCDLSSHSTSPTRNFLKSQYLYIFIFTYPRQMCRTVTLLLSKYIIFMYAWCMMVQWKSSSPFSWIDALEGGYYLWKKGFHRWYYYWSWF